MKVVILAAGRGKRMKPLTNNRPKPLVIIRGKTFLERTIDIFIAKDKTTEFIIVVGFLGDQIKSFVRNHYPGLSVNFVVQEELSGTGSALMLTKDYFSLKEKFVVCYADEYFTEEDVNKCLQYKYSWLSLRVSHPERSAVPVIDERGVLVDLVEKPISPKSNQVLGGLMVIDADIFNYQPILNPTKKEYYLSEMMLKFISSHSVYIVPAKYNYSFSTAEEVEHFNRLYGTV